MRTEPSRTRALLVVLLLTATVVSAGAQDAPPPPPAASPPPAQTSGVRPDKVITGDFVVRAGEVIDDKLVVVGGDLRVRGEVTGDAVVVGGNLIMEESGVVRGDAHVTGGELRREGGRVMGEMRVVDGVGDRAAAETASAEAARAGVEANERAGAMAAGRESRGEGRGRSFHRSWFDSIGRGFAGLIQTLALGLVLGGIGALLIFYGHRYLDTVSDTVRTSTLRSVGVGLAAGFLIVPAFVVLVVALAVTIIGIPLLLLAVPLYPLAVAAAIAFGLLAAAHALGEHTAERKREGYDLRYRNSYTYLFTGLGMFLVPLLMADLISMTGFLGFIGTLLKVVTWVVIWAAATAGLGAVILSRGGTLRVFARRPQPEPPFDGDPFFDAETTTTGGSNV